MTPPSFTLRYRASGLVQHGIQPTRRQNSGWPEPELLRAWR